MCSIVDIRKQAARQIKLTKRKICKTRQILDQDIGEGSLREQLGMKICDMEARLLDLIQLFSLAELSDISSQDMEKTLNLAHRSGIKIATETPPLIRPTNKAKKAKRLPYHVYTSSEGVNILLGRSATENDQLSTNPANRSDDHWWMHISNYTGAHVVICSTTENLLKTHPRTVVEAALLAATNSSCKKQACTVDLTRCRYVHKDSRDPDGMVRLSDIVTVVRVDLDASRDDLTSVVSTKNKQCLE